MARTRATASFPAFIEYTTPWFQPAKHHRLLIDRLTAIERRDIYRLIVLMPPGSAKSTYASVLFPPWYLGRHADHSVLAVSNVDPLAQRFGRRARNLVGTQEYRDVFAFGLNPEITSVTQWETQRGGEYYGTGMGGGIGGRRVDLGLIDDPLKGRKEADSKLVRDAQWDWYKSDFRPRMKPNAVIVLVTTHWHHDDLAGRLINEMQFGGEHWDVLCLPMECESADDSIGREIGEMLWPEWFRANEIAEFKKDSRTWNALYQQRPSAEGGNIAKREWWKRFAVAPAHFDQMIQSWDMSFKDRDTSSYVVGQVWGRVGANKYLLDQLRERMGFSATLQAFQDMSAKWPRAVAKLVEDKANGTAIIDALKNKISGIIAVEPEGSKEARAEAVSPQIEAGNAWLPEHAPWVHDFIEEWAEFPESANNDQVDAGSQALLHLNRNQRGAQVASSGERVFGGRGNSYGVPRFLDRPEFVLIESSFSTQRCRPGRTMN
jgi:predicted phage terminase large subunit-like protein